MELQVPTASIKKERIIKDSKKVNISFNRTCSCGKTNINCMTPKEWMKSQLGVWQFTYESRDIRDKNLHPATFPISLAKKFIQLFSHTGELIVDPFAGSGTTLLAAQDLGRNAVGFDLKAEYVELSNKRTGGTLNFHDSKQIAICDNARNITDYLNEETVSLLITSPPYANLLNRQRKNKSRRGDQRKNEQYLKVEQYSQDPADLGTMDIDQYKTEIALIYKNLLPLLKKKGHCLINVPDFWWENQRITIHIAVVDALRSVGYELRNTIIWDRTNIVNNIGIFGWPSNYITMGTTFEYLLDFWRPVD